MSETKLDGGTSVALRVNAARACLLAIGLAACAATGIAFAAQGNPGIAPIDSRIATVQTYTDLGAEWWQWALAAPAADTPLFDATGEKCAVGQYGPVWFLAGTMGSGGHTERSCEVPPGKAIFFPVINLAYLAFLNDPPETRTLEFLRAQLAGCDSTSIHDVSVKIDGVAVARPLRYETSAEESPLFEVQLPTDNPFGLTPEVAERLLLSPSIHKGWYLYVKPLTPGSHRIEWTATWNCGSEDVAYNLNVLATVPGLEP
jgi:hypothetical protein